MFCDYGILAMLHLTVYHSVFLSARISIFSHPTYWLKFYKLPHHVETPENKGV